MKLLPYQEVKDKIVHLRKQDVILDFAVAELYGVETREINQAVRNNPDKFPDGYIIEVSKTELVSLRSKILTLKTGGRGQRTNQRRVFHLPVQVAQFIKPGPKLQYGCIARTPVRNRTATVGTGIRNSIH